MALKAELERRYIIGPVLKTVIYCLVKSKGFYYRSIPEDLEPGMQNVRVSYTSEVEKAECCRYRFHIAPYKS